MSFFLVVEGITIHVALYQMAACKITDRGAGKEFHLKQTT